MKILHTSDWHLGKRLDHYSRLAEQKEVMHEICEIADKEKIDLVLLAGDMFDTFNPSTEAINLYYSTLKRLSNNGNRAVVLIAGNHDSADLIEAVDPLARTCGIITAGFPDSQPQIFQLDTGLEVTLSDKGFLCLQIPGIAYPVRIILSPYANEKRLKKYLGTVDQEQEMRDLLTSTWNNLADKYCDDKGVNLFISHLFFLKKGEQTQSEPEAEKPILHIGGAQSIYSSSIPNSIQYAALGHLHRRQTIDDTHAEVVYCGSPIAYSFGESDQDKYVMIIDVKPNTKVKSKKILLSEGKRLLRAKFESIDDAITWLTDNQNALVELTIISDEYLKAIDRKRLYDIHSGIINIIPEIKNTTSISDSSNKTAIDLDQDVQALFQQYFQHKHGQEANENIVELLKEVIAVTD